MSLCLKFILNCNVNSLSGIWFLSVGLVLKVIYLFIIKTNVLVILYYPGGVFLF